MQIKQITTNNHYFKEIINIYYKWWGSNKNKTYNEILSLYQESLTNSSLPKIYALIINDTLIGTYTLDKYDDITTEKYTPYLANLFIKEQYRHKGYSKILIEDAKTKTLNLNYKDLYLHSNHHNYYENYDFKFLKEVKTEYGIKRVYKCSLKK